MLEQTLTSIPIDKLEEFHLQMQISQTKQIEKSGHNSIVKSNNT